MSRDSAGHREKAPGLKIRHLTAFVEADGHASKLGRAVQSLLEAHAFGASLIGPERDILEDYATCGATYGDPKIRDAIHFLLSVVNREGVCLGKVSVAKESAVDGSRDAVRVDLHVLQQSCEEAIANRSRDGAIPRVVISADVLLAVASFAKGLSREVSRSLSKFEHLSELTPLVRFATQGPVIGGAGAADAWGEVVKPFVVEVATSISIPSDAEEESPDDHPPAPTAPSPSIIDLDPVDTILPDQRLVLERMIRERDYGDEIVGAIQSGLKALLGDAIHPSWFETLRRFAHELERLTRESLTAKPRGPNWMRKRDSDAVQALLRALDVATGLSLLRWTEARYRSLKEWLGRSLLGRLDVIDQVVHDALARALNAVRTGDELIDDARGVLERWLSELHVRASRQITAANVRSLLAAIPRRSDAERGARMYAPPRFNPVQPDSDLCSLCGRDRRRHYGLGHEQRCRPIDADVPGVDLQAAATLGKIPALSRVVLWRICAIDLATGDAHLAHDVNTGLAALDTSGHRAPPSLGAIRSWLTKHGRYREEDDATVSAMRDLVTALDQLGRGA